MSSKPKIVCLFDVDGTLTLPRQVKTAFLPTTVEMLSQFYIIALSITVSNTV